MFWEMANVPLVPPKELSLPPPTRFVLREERQKFISIPSQKKKKKSDASRPRAESAEWDKSKESKLKMKTITNKDESNSFPGAAFPSFATRGYCNTASQRRQEGPSELAANWRTCAVNPWVLTTIDRGYRLQFAVQPSMFNGVLISVARGEAAQVLEEEISSLMRKGVIRVIPRRESHLGFYSQYFVIPKKGEGLLPILVLRVLNKHLRKYKFKMLSLRTLCQSIYQGDWFISVDLQDASMHNKVLCKCIIHSIIFSHRYFSCSQEISEVCLSGHSIRVYENSLWPPGFSANVWKQL